MTDRSVSRFRDQVMQVQPSIGKGGDPFAQAYANEVKQITDMLLSATEEADVGKFDRLIVAWLDWFGDRSYRHLAESINTGYSRTFDMMEQQAIAAAEHEAFVAVKSWRDFGIFEMARTARRP